MAFDTKYRPVNYSDVVGQEHICKILQQYVKSGAGYHQSYLFCGQFGSGKTTTARILARTLLCAAPVEGLACNQCSSCLSMLEKGTAESFIEFDAASNSGKDDIKEITDVIQYDTLSGRRRIYLIDEAHRLSASALDALLKPMEDTVPGSEDKLMVCIFCTTEPEKMKDTVFSRCAPAFMIKPVAPDRIASRLAYVCSHENIEYDIDALTLIAEVKECHIRDTLKAVESIGMFGKITLDAVKEHLRLNANHLYVEILQAVRSDTTKLVSLVGQLQERVSPATAYERLSEVAMLCYRLSLGIGVIPSYWDKATLKNLGMEYGAFLIQITLVLSKRPSHPTYDMLMCDLIHLSMGGVSFAPVQTMPSIAPGNYLPPPMTEKTPVAQSQGIKSKEIEQQPKKAPIVKYQVDVPEFRELLLVTLDALGVKNVGGSKR